MISFLTKHSHMKIDYINYNKIMNSIFIDYLKTFNIPLYLKKYENYTDMAYTISNEPFYHNPHDKKNAHFKYSLNPVNFDDFHLNFFKPHKDVTLDLDERSKLYIYSKLIEKEVPQAVIKKIKLISNNDNNFNNWDGIISLYYYSQRYSQSSYSANYQKSFFISSEESFSLIFNNYVAPIKSSTLSKILNIFSENKNHPNIESITNNFLTNNTDNLLEQNKMVIYHWLLETFPDKQKLIDQFAHFNTIEKNSLFSEKKEVFSYLKISQPSLVQNVPLIQGHMGDNKDYELVMTFLVKSIKHHIEQNPESNLGIQNIFFKNLGIKKNEYLLILETGDDYSEKHFKQLFHSLLKLYQSQFKAQQELEENKKITFYLLSAKTNKFINENNLITPQLEYFHLHSTLPDAKISVKHKKI